MSEEKSFISEVKKTVKTGNPDSNIPSFFENSSTSPIDREYSNLLAQINPDLTPKKRIQVYEESKNESKLKFEAHIDQFKVGRASDMEKYKELINELYNNHETFADYRVFRNWDKAGFLTIVVEYVKVIEEKTEKVKEIMSAKPPTKRTKVSKADPGIQDKAFPSEEEENLADETFVEYSEDLPEDIEEALE